jgi:ADP-ribosylglycohydrolase
MAAEMDQLAEEGVDVVSLRADLATVRTLAENERSQAYAELLSALDKHLAASTDAEPAEWDAIQAQRPAGVPLPAPSLDRYALNDRLLGGYLGRCAGCMLGKPFEGRQVHKDDIARFLREANAYPLAAYFAITPELEGRYKLHGSYKRATLGNISGMPRDDDIDYVILNLLILEKYGFAVQSGNCADEWLFRLPYHRIWSAARAAYRNMINGLEPPQTGYYRNPYRESLGGQIRADLWGYVTPGDPALAADLAYRDGRVSQTRNGIYSEMFFAAAIAACFSAAGIEQAIAAGLAQIPAQCKLAQAIRQLLVWVAADRRWEDTLERVYGIYGQQRFNHGIINAVLSLLGPLYFPDDFGRAVGVTVMGGFDTDCTGATAGSLMGVLHSARGIPSSWTAPLEDRCESHVAGIGQIRISELVKRTQSLARV